METVRKERLVICLKINCRFGFAALRFIVKESKYLVFNYTFIVFSLSE